MSERTFNKKKKDGFSYGVLKNPVCAGSFTNKLEDDMPVDEGTIYPVDVKLLRKAFIKQCSDRLVYGKVKWGKLNWTKFSIRWLVNNCQRKVNILNQFSYERQLKRHAVCLERDAVDLANYAFFLWAQAKYEGELDKGNLSPFPQFNNLNKMTASSTFKKISQKRIAAIIERVNEFKLERKKNKNF